MFIPNARARVAAASTRRKPTAVEDKLFPRVVCLPRDLFLRPPGLQRLLQADVKPKPPRIAETWRLPAAPDSINPKNLSRRKPRTVRCGTPAVKILRANPCDVSCVVANMWCELTWRKLFGANYVVETTMCKLCNGGDVVVSAGCTLYGAGQVV